MSIIIYVNISSLIDIVIQTWNSLPDSVVASSTINGKRDDPVTRQKSFKFNFFNIQQ